MRGLVICSVVTERVIEEYLLMRFSFSLHHRTEPVWHVRCDKATRARLRRELPDTSTSVFVDVAPAFASQWSIEFRSIVEQKMLAMRDGWKKVGTQAVLFLDADIVFTRPLLPALAVMKDRLVLTPHYWPSGAQHKADRYGYYNSGFVFTRDRAFWKWWLASFRKHPEAFTDQWCLNLVSEYMPPRDGPPGWNVGYWRRDDAWSLPALPDDMTFFHGHVFADANPESSYECGQRDFSLGLFAYLSQRGRKPDRMLLQRMFDRAPNAYYRHAMNGDFAVITQCDVSRAGRAVLLARSLPPQVKVVCAVNGPADRFWRVAGTQSRPANLHAVFFPRSHEHPTNFLRNRAFEAATARWLCFVDIDFVFQRGFWYLLFARYERELRDGACVCPAPLWSPAARYFDGDRDSWADSEIMSNHRPPEGWDTAHGVHMFRFHERWFPSGQLGPRFARHDITARLLAQRHNMHPPEPWGVLDRRNFAWADEDFTGRSMDKQQFICALLDRGVRFHFAPDLFIFHNHHPATNAPRDRPERGLNVTLWARRYAGKPARFLHFALPSLASAAVCDASVSALSRIYGEKRLFERLQPASNGAHGADATALEYKVVDALFREIRYVLVEANFDELFLGYGYRIFTVIEDPVDYWIARAMHANGHSPRGRSCNARVEELIQDGTLSDGRLVRHFAGKRGGIFKAVDNLQHLAFVADAGDPDRMRSLVSNVLSSRVELAGLPRPRRVIDGKLRARVSELIPEDIELYRFIKSSTSIGRNARPARKHSEPSTRSISHVSRLGHQAGSSGDHHQM